MRIKLLVLLTLSICVGCSHSETLQFAEAGRLAQFNAEAADRAATVTLLSGGEYAARALQVAPDSTSWLNPESNEVVSVPTYDVADVRFRNHGRGAVNGLVGGAVGAGLFGFLIGLASGSEPEPCLLFCTAGEKATALGVGFGLFGGVLGLIGGAASGSEEVYRVDVTESPGRVSRER